MYRNPNTSKIIETHISKEVGISIEDIEFHPNFIVESYLRVQDRPIEEIALGAKKSTEMIKLQITSIPEGVSLDVISGNKSAIKSAFYSAAFILQRVVADKLDIEPREIEISELKIENNVPYLYLSDAAPNGSGFVNYLYENFDEILNEILEGKNNFIKSIIKHRDECSTSCQKCLNAYDNSGYHHILDWRLGVGLLRLLTNFNYNFGLDGNLSQYFELQDLHDLINKRAVTLSKVNPKIKAIQSRNMLYYLEETTIDIMGSNIVNSLIVHPLWNQQFLNRHSNLLISNIDFTRYISFFELYRTIKE